MFGAMAQELESKPKVIFQDRKTEKGGAKCVLTISEEKLSQQPSII
jgi:hypothetical protein